MCPHAGMAASLSAGGSWEAGTVPYLQARSRSRSAWRSHRDVVLLLSRSFCAPRVALSQRRSVDKSAWSTSLALRPFTASLTLLGTWPIVFWDRSRFAARPSSCVFPEMLKREELAPRTPGFRQ